MKVYILTEYIRNDYEEPIREIKGVYNNYKKAITERQKLIDDNIENYGYILDKDLKENDIKCYANILLFWNFQENWDNYIEYNIVESEVE